MTVFLDRDGVICANRDDYVKSWDEMVILPGVASSIASMNKAGHQVFVITNQSAVGRGVIDRATLEDMHTLMVHTLARDGARIDGIFYCPHAPKDGCACRKPQPGLFHQAAAGHGLDLHGSWMVGDAKSDIDAARAAGCGAILVLTGRGLDQLNGNDWDGAHPDFVAADLAQAAEWILARSAQGRAEVNG